jgi:hypothetical protein
MDEGLLYNSGDDTPEELSDYDAGYKHGNYEGRKTGLMVGIMGTTVITLIASSIGFLIAVYV